MLCRYSWVKVLKEFLDFWTGQIIFYSQNNRPLDLSLYNALNDFDFCRLLLRYIISTSSSCITKFLRMEFTDGTPDAVAMVTGPVEAVVADQHAGVVGVPLVVAKRLGDRVPIDVARVQILTGRLPNPTSKILDATRPEIAACLYTKWSYVREIHFPNVISVLLWVTRYLIPRCLKWPDLLPEFQPTPTTCRYRRRKLSGRFDSSENNPRAMEI